MFSDDEDNFGVGGIRSPSPNRDSQRESNRERRRPADDDRGPRGKGDKGSGRQDRRRTTGREIPKLFSIHKGTVARVQDYGAFVRLGDGSRYKDGLLHISRLSASGRVDAVSDVLAQDDAVWVKVVEVKEEEGKFSLDMRFVGQKDGEDQDPNNVQVDAGRGKGQGKAPDPIRIGAIQATTCSRCGARGHGARECWAGGGKQYDLVEEAPEPLAKAGGKGLEDAAEGHDAAVVKKALKAYFKRKAADSSSSSSSSDKKKKKKKEKKKEKKKKKKEKEKKKKEKKDKSAKEE